MDGALWRLPFGGHVHRIDRLPLSRLLSGGALFFKPRPACGRSRRRFPDRFRSFRVASGAGLDHDPVIDCAASVRLDAVWRPRFLVPRVAEARSTRLDWLSSLCNGRRDCGSSPRSRRVLRPRFHLPGPRFRAPQETKTTRSIGWFWSLWTASSRAVRTRPHWARPLAIRAFSPPQRSHCAEGAFYSSKSDPQWGRSPLKGSWGDRRVEGC